MFSRMEPESVLWRICVEFLWKDRLATRNVEFMKHMGRYMVISDA